MNQILERLAAPVVAQRELPRERHVALGQLRTRLTVAAPLAPLKPLVLPTVAPPGAVAVIGSR